MGKKKLQIVTPCDTLELFKYKTGGERGIRTLGGLLLGGFQDRCHRPLSHLSAIIDAGITKAFRVNNMAFSVEKSNGLAQNSPVSTGAAKKSKGNTRVQPSCVMAVRQIGSHKTIRLQCQGSGISPDWQSQNN